MTRSRAFAFASVVLAQACAFPGHPNSDAPATLVVIGRKAFESHLTPYMAHRNLDLTCEFVALETILAKTSGIDDGERVKRYLFDRWKRQNLHYALLVGDADNLPIRYMCLDRTSPDAANYAFYPTDLYYADLADSAGEFDDWNARKDDFHGQYFGEVRGEYNKSDPINLDMVSYIPEIGVGRWPVSTGEEAAAIAKKTMEYEKSIDSGSHTKPRRAVFVSIDGWVDTKAIMAAWAVELPAGWASATLASGSATPPDEAQIVKVMQEGAGLVFHAGHGFDDGWDRSVNIHSIARFENGDRLPLILSAGCSTARFAVLPPYEPYLDILGSAHAGTNAGEKFASPPPAPSCYQGGLYNRSGFGEALLRTPGGGAVAYFGCNTGSQPCGLTLLGGFVKSMASVKDPRPRLGDLWRSTIQYYVDKERLFELAPDGGWYPPSIFFQGMKFMLFGDPALRMPGAARQGSTANSPL